MQKTIYVIGVFDLFHRGHLEILKRSKDIGNRLIVAVNADDLVSQYKRKPFFSENDRLELVKACKYVDDAFIITEFDNKEYIKKYQVDVIVHGDDWDREGYMKQIRVTQAYLDESKVTLCLVPYTQGISTSGLIKTIRET